MPFIWMSKEDVRRIAREEAERETSLKKENDRFNWYTRNEFQKRIYDSLWKMTIIDKDISAVAAIKAILDHLGMQIYASPAKVELKKKEE